MVNPIGQRSTQVQLEFLTPVDPLQRSLRFGPTVLRCGRHTEKCEKYRSLTAGGPILLHLRALVCPMIYMFFVYPEPKGDWIGRTNLSSNPQ